MIKHCIAVMILSFLITMVKGQEKREEIEKLKEETLKEINYANEILRETQGRKDASLNDLSVISHLLEKRKELVNEMENELQEISWLISDNYGRIEQIEAQVKKIKENYAKIIVNAYKNRRKNYMAMYLLAAENMNQAYKRIRYIRIYNEYQRRQAERMAEMNNELRSRNDTLKIMYEEKERIISATNSENMKIREEAEQKNKIISDLEKREKELLNEIRNKETVAKRLENELAAIIEEERRKANNAILLETLTPEERLISDEFGKNKGKLPWPTEQGIVTGKYGEHAHPDYKSVTVRNGGIYISTIPGTEVNAIFKGVVSGVFSIPGENYTIIIRHGEYFTLYHNLINVKVSKGQEVETRQFIGNVYTDNKTRESVLYFQVWKEEERNDPEVWLSSDK
ncbi:MAG: peptidoglycan DD-metalloendopeptidase family protein [Bacteroidales bacterium]|nr:peptidoglycan DD-metalloendopeptidase family protein [Bacteroidales bacterium]